MITEVDGQNIWFLAKEKHGEIGSYIKDVRLAWHQACQAFEKNPSQAIGLLCRYALINASISSIANVPSDLIVALVEYSEWTPEQGFAYARQMPSLSKRIIALEGLLDLPDLNQNFPDTFAEIQDELRRLRLLAKDSLDDKVDQISSDSSHPLTSTLWQQAMQEILEVSEQKQQIQRLNELIQRGLNSQSLQEIPNNILDAILDIVLNSKFERYQAQILTKVAPYLKDDLIQEKILRTARSISDKDRKVRLFAALIKKLPNSSQALKSLKREMLREARDIASFIRKDEWDLIEVRIKLVSQLCSTQETKLQEIAYSEIRTILSAKWSFQENQVSALIELAPYILDSLQLQQEAYNISLAIQDNLDKAKVIIALVPYLADSLKEESCNKLLNIQEYLNEQDKEILIETLTQLLPHLPKQLEHKFLDCILKSIARINNNAWKDRDWQIKEELKSLTVYLQGWFRWRATRIVMRMASSRAKVEALAELASIFPDPIKKEKLLKKALDTYKLFSEPTQQLREELTSGSVPHEFPSLSAKDNLPLKPLPLMKVLKSQEHKVDPLVKVGTLTELAKCCSNPLRQEVLEIILITIVEIQDETLQVEILTGLLAQDFPDFQTQQSLREQVLAIALETKSKIQDKGIHIKALTKLVMHFPDFQTQEVLGKILQSTSEIEDDLETRFNVLTQIALNSVAFVHGEVWQQIQKTFAESKKQEDQEELQVKKLIELLSNFSNEFKQEALQQAQETASYLHDVKLKVDLLIALIPQLPDQDKLENWYEACKSALTIPDKWIRKGILSELVQLLIRLLDLIDEKLLKPLLKSLWYETFNIKADYSVQGQLMNRQNLLININVLSPTLCIFGETNSTPEILNEVQNVQRWWP